MTAGPASARAPIPSLRRWPLGEPRIRANSALRYEDLSWRARFGCKGPLAEDWLASLGLIVPPEANSALLTAGVLVARLARSEFLVEAVASGFDAVASAARGLQRAAPSPNVYPVARQDIVIGIEGPGCNRLLRQICSVDFAPLLVAGGSDAGPVVLTSMVGVSVLARPQPKGGAPSLTLWLDPSFGHYFCSTILEVGGGIGGAFSATVSEGDRRPQPTI